MGLIDQGSKPSGLVGIIIGKMMNRLQTQTYKNYFHNNLPKDNSQILDIGCGGGKFLNFLSKSNSTYKLFGIDHSPEMVRMSKRVNRKAIKSNQIKVFESSVEKLEFEHNSFDLVTAFETIQFWPDTLNNFKSLAELLKKDGKFLIINLYPQQGTEWYNRLKLKSESEYIDTLKQAGFNNIKTDLGFKKGWIIVEAIK